jgi:hypothetical protein
MLLAASTSLACRTMAERDCYYSSFLSTPVQHHRSTDARIRIARDGSESKILTYRQYSVQESKSPINFNEAMLIVEFPFARRFYPLAQLDFAAIRQSPESAINATTESGIIILWGDIFNARVGTRCQKQLSEESKSQIPGL